MRLLSTSEKATTWIWTQDYALHESKRVPDLEAETTFCFNIIHQPDLKVEITICITAAGYLSINQILPTASALPVTFVLRYILPTWSEQDYFLTQEGSYLNFKQLLPTELIQPDTYFEAVVTVFLRGTGYLSLRPRLLSGSEQPATWT